jgi:hypothetical protein
MNRVPYDTISQHESRNFVAPQEIPPPVLPGKRDLSALDREKIGLSLISLFGK